jgi:transcriptional/translational regulatory protein YebC/TACO1
MNIGTIMKIITNQEEQDGILQKNMMNYKNFKEYSGEMSAVDLCDAIVEAKEIEIPANLKDLAETKHAELIEAVAEFDIADLFEEDGFITIYGNSSDYQGIRDALVAAKPDLTFVEDQVTYVPQTTVTLTDQKEIDQFNRLRSLLDDVDDVQDLFHNIVGLDEEEE